MREEPRFPKTLRPTCTSMVQTNRPRPHVAQRYQYKKCGVMLMELTVKAQRQETLFDDVAARDKAAKTMAVMDSINRVWGRGTLRSGAAGNSKLWAMRSENRSPRYTTQWEEIPTAS